MIYFSSIQGKSKDSIISTKSSSGLIAVGSKKGTVSVWKLETGDVVHRFGYDGDDGHESQVNALVFGRTGTTLYSAGQDGVVLEWDMTTGKIVRSLPLFKTSISKLAISTSGNLLLVASSSIKLVDLSTGNVVAEYTGIVSNVSSLTFSPDDKTFAVGCEDDRFVNLWPITYNPDAPVEQPKKKTKKAAASSDFVIINLPLASVSLDSAPIDIAIQCVSSPVVATTRSKKAASAPSTTMYIAVVSSRSVATVWDVSESISAFYASSFTTLSKEVKTYAHANCEIDVKNNTAQDGSSVVAMSNFATKKVKKGRQETSTAVSSTVEGAIQAVQFVGTNQVHLARYSSIQPQFELVAYADESGIFLPNIILPEFTTQHMAVVSTDSAAKNKKDADALATTTSSATVVGPALMSITAASSALDADAVMDSYQQDGESVQDKRMRLLAASGELTRSLAQRIQSARDQVNMFADQPMSGSLQTMLTQAIHTNDDRMLEQCISIGASRSNRSLKSHTIKNTVARLAPTYVVPLVSRLINKLQGNPNRGLELIPWIRECLRQHTTHLITVSNLSSQLSTLYKIVEQRLIPHKKLLSIQGRLDLILSQVNRTSGGFSAAAQGSTLEYNEAADMAQEARNAAAAAYGDDGDYDEEDMEGDEDMFEEEGVEFENNDDFDDDQ